MLLLQLIFVILFHVTLADDKKEYYEVNSSERVNALFENFLQKYDKNYDAAEKLKRLHTFNETLAEINRLNDEYPHTIFGINRFTDQTSEEMKAYTGFLTTSGHYSACVEHGDPQTHSAPGDLDWRQQGAVTSVKDQKLCGSCWAFSATATIESRYSYVTGKKLDLSEQQVVDCDDVSFGCLGGKVTLAFTALIQEGGQELEADYPYRANMDMCLFNSSKIAITVASCSTYNLSSEDNLKEVLSKEGPLSISIDATQHSFRTYSGGILTDCEHRSLSHSVQLVGYGSAKQMDYWIIKNSWSPSWGESGYVRIKRGAQCLGLLADVNSVNLGINTA